MGRLSEAPARKNSVWTKTGAVTGELAKSTMHPNSLTARAQAKVAPTRIPRDARGREMRAKVAAGDAPRLREASSYCRGTASKAVMAVFTRKGAATNTCAITMPSSDPEIGKPRLSSALPSTLPGPSNTMSATPATDCGTRMGTSTMDSTQRLPGKSMRARA